MTDDRPVESDLKSEYYFFLRKLKQSGFSLLIYDSCDKLEVIERFMPTEDARIHVIVTTRQRDGHNLLHKNADRVVHLDVLEPEDAVDALLAWKGAEQNPFRTTHDDRERLNAQILVNRLEIGRLPLAIRHAGTHMKEMKISCEEYVELLANKKEKLQAVGNDLSEILKYSGLQHLTDALRDELIENVDDFRTRDLSQLQPSSRIKPHELERLSRMKAKLEAATVMAWDLDIEIILKNSNETSSRILQMASLLDGKVISKDLLLNLVLKQNGNYSDGKWKLNQAITRLSRLSLVNDSNDCSIHGLVQQSVVEEMMREGTFAFQLRLLCFFLTGMLNQSSVDIRKRLNDKNVMDLVPHVYVVSGHILRSEQLDEKCWKVLEISCRMARLYEHLEEAEHLCEERLALIKRINSHLLQMYNEKLLIGKLNAMVACWLKCVQNVIYFLLY